mgnify:CR=1 FL=1
MKFLILSIVVFFLVGWSLPMCQATKPDLGVVDKAFHEIKAKQLHQTVFPDYDFALVNKATGHEVLQKELIGTVLNCRDRVCDFDGKDSYPIKTIEKTVFQQESFQKVCANQLYLTADPKTELKNLKKIFQKLNQAKCQVSVLAMLNIKPQYLQTLQERKEWYQETITLAGAQKQTAFANHILTAIADCNPLQQAFEALATAPQNQRLNLLQQTFQDPTSREQVSQCPVLTEDLIILLEMFRASTQQIAKPVTFTSKGKKKTINAKKGTWELATKRTFARKKKVQTWRY